MLHSKQFQGLLFDQCINILEWILKKLNFNAKTSSYLFKCLQSFLAKFFTIFTRIENITICTTPTIEEINTIVCVCLVVKSWFSCTTYTFKNWFFVTSSYINKISQKIRNKSEIRRETYKPGSCGKLSESWPNVIFTMATIINKMNNKNFIFNHKVLSNRFKCKSKWVWRWLANLFAFYTNVKRMINVNWTL